MVSPLRILFDGWPIAHHPASPAALHLLAILENIPSGVQPIVAVPEAPPEWFPQVPFHVQETPTQDQFIWEQCSLPRLARHLDVQLLHLFFASAPLLGGARVIVSPCGFNPVGSPDLGQDLRRAGLQARLRQSIRLGGMARAQAIFWPHDLTIDDQPTIFESMPPLVFSGFTPIAHTANETRQNGSAQSWSELRQLDLPETYLLYHGPASGPAINRLLEAWSWAAGPIGDYHPLIVLGFNAVERDQLTEIAESFDLGGTVRMLPELSPRAIALLYQRSSALFHPAPEPVWGGPIRHALACGKPVVASLDPQTSRLVGPAAYLVPEDDTRALGAALITVIVEEEVAEALARAARLHASTWSGAVYSQALSGAYQRILASR